MASYPDPRRAGLTRIRPAELEISRRRCGRGFTYRRAGTLVTDARIRARIAELAIPPAWTRVRIAADPDAHLQACGVDAAGRRQYLYHEAWHARRAAQKFDRVQGLSAALPRARPRLRSAMAGRGAGRLRVGAAAVHLLDLSALRIGSAPAHPGADDGYGLTTLLRGHVRLGRHDRVCLRFPGKGGIRRAVTVHSPALASVITAMRRIGTDDRLWHHRDGSGLHRLTAAQVNDDVATMIGAPFSAKDLRTWHATTAAAWFLAHGGPADDPEAAIRAAIDAVAAVIGDTRAVTRASYVDPRVFDAYRAGRTIRPFGDRWQQVCADDALRARADRAVGRLLRG